MSNFIKLYPQNISSSTCQELIALFNSAHKRKATVPGVTGNAIDKNRKDSTDLPVSKIPESLRKKYSHTFNDYQLSLEKVLMEYIEEFSILKPPQTFPLALFNFNIQRYYPGGQAYHAWHYESPYPKVAHRILTFMTYLNTVKKGGETEFLYQDISVSPEEGTTLIWPCGFTHTHRGLPAPDEVKFILTGWFEFDHTQMHKLSG